MPDIQLRFHNDMLVLSAPIDAALRERGFEEEQERELLLAVEPETVLEPLRLNMIAGAQCLVLPTAGITRARLSHVRAEDNAADIAGVAQVLAKELKPQHVLAEIGPTGLPLDATSETSVAANREQYASAAAGFNLEKLDAIFLNGMTSIDDVRCALQGVRDTTDIPVFVSVAVDEDGKLLGRNEGISQALFVMEEYGAQVAGIQTSAAPEVAAAFVGRMAEACSLPILVQIDVQNIAPRDPMDGSPYWHADLIMGAVAPLRAAGAQFLRACGVATAAYTGALVAASSGLPVLGRG